MDHKFYKKNIKKMSFSRSFSSWGFLFVSLVFICQQVSQVECTLRLQKQLQIHQGEVKSIQFSSDYSRFVTVSNDSTFILWDTTTVAQITSKTLTGQINDVAINLATNEIISLLQNGKVQIYDLTTFVLKKSYDYPNSGYGNNIALISNGEKYITGGFDSATTALYLHFFDKYHNYLSSIHTKFTPGSEITTIFNAFDTLFFVSSSESTAPVGIEMYSYDKNTGSYVLAKRYYDSSANVKGMSLKMDGANFFSVADDLTLRNYTKSPFDDLYEVTSVVYYDESPLAVNALVPVVTYVSTPKQIIEYFRSGQVHLQSHYPTSSPINQIINLFPTLMCTTTDGKLIIYKIEIFDGQDHDMTKWIVLSVVMSTVVVGLLVAMAHEIRYNRKMQRASHSEDVEGESLNQTAKTMRDQIP